MADAGEKNIASLKGEVLDLAALVAYQEGSVVSREVMRGKAGTVTVFAFDAGEGLSEHTAPFDALVQVMDGSAEISIGGDSHMVDESQSIIMPAGVPHSLHAPVRFKMLLTLIRE
ncbi:MAG: cupin domain-containing protein [Candidatus Geothermincolia bacterium]